MTDCSVAQSVLEGQKSSNELSETTTTMCPVSICINRRTSKRPEKTKPVRSKSFYKCFQWAAVLYRWASIDDNISDILSINSAVSRLPERTTTICSMSYQHYHQCATRENDHNLFHVLSAVLSVRHQRGRSQSVRCLISSAISGLLERTAKSVRYLCYQQCYA